MRWKIVLLVLAFVSAAQHAFAQDRMWFFLMMSEREIAVTQIDITDLGRTWSTTGKWTLPSTGYPLTAKVPFQGGRYLVWLAQNGDTSVLTYLDTRSGQNGVIPGLSFGGSFGSDRPSITVDRSSSRVLVLDTRGVWILDPRTASVKLIPLPSEGETRSVQAAGGRVFVTHSRAFDPPEVLVIDPESGAQLAAFPRTWRLEFTRDEKSFFLVSSDAAPDDTQWLYRHDMATLARVTEVQFTNDSTLLDNVRLTASVGADGVRRVQVYDADARNLLTEVLPGVYTGRGVDFSRPGPRSPLYAEHYTFIGNLYNDVRIDAIDPATATVVRSVRPTSNFTGGLFPDAMISAPEAPTARATVANRTVTIAWDAVEHAGDYQLEAGSRPGARDIVTFNTGGVTHVTVPNVPTGIYYVRLRTINELGVSGASADLSIQVP